MTYLGKVPVSVRLAPGLARQLRDTAAQRGVSMTSLVEQACERADWATVELPAVRSMEDESDLAALAAEGIRRARGAG